MPQVYTVQGGGRTKNLCFLSPWDRSKAKRDLNIFPQEVHLTRDFKLTSVCFSIAIRTHINGIYVEGLRKSVSNRKLDFLDKLLERFDKHIRLEKFQIMLRVRDSIWSIALKDENWVRNNTRDGVRRIYGNYNDYVSTIKILVIPSKNAKI